MTCACGPAGSRPLSRHPGNTLAIVNRAPPKADYRPRQLATTRCFPPEPAAGSCANPHVRPLSTERCRRSIRSASSHRPECATWRGTVTLVLVDEGTQAVSSGPQDCVSPASRSPHPRVVGAAGLQRPQPPMVGCSAQSNRRAQRRPVVPTSGCRALTAARALHYGAGLRIVPAL